MKIGLFVNCEICGSEFSPVNKNHRFCSRNCVRKNFYNNHPGKMKEKRLWGHRNPVAQMFSRVKSRALREGIPFDIDKSDISIPEVCPVLGILLSRNIGRRGYSPSSPSLDRIDPGMGYVKGNVRVISARANLLKSDATIDELSLVLQDLINLAT